MGEGLGVNSTTAQKQKLMLKTMSTQGLLAKWGYLRRSAPGKNLARQLARKIEKELIRRGAMVEGDSETTLSEESS